MRTINNTKEWELLSDKCLINTAGGSNEAFDKGFEIGERIGEKNGAIIAGVLALRGLK